MASPLHPDPSAYDREFTFSRIGMAQRRMVWGYMDQMLQVPQMNVLELNCGTGTDAVHLARNGHRVLATDISEEMLKVAAEKARQYGVEDRIRHQRLNFEDLGQLTIAPVDLVLSNFGGLNCVDRPHLFALEEHLAGVLKPGGRFIAVLMPDRCIAETVYHFLRGEWRTAFRRGRHDPVWAGLSGSGVVTWFHPPDLMQRAFSKRFKVMGLRPIGFFLPPTHLEHRIGHRSGLLNGLVRLDGLVADWRWAARYSDHYLIDLERIR